MLWLVETNIFVPLHKGKFRLVSMKGYENAINAMNEIRGMETGNKYYEPDSPIPIAYVRPYLVDEAEDTYLFMVGIRYATDEMRDKYLDDLKKKTFEKAQDAADYIIDIADKENGVK